jgi:hypothetical protein
MERHLRRSGLLRAFEDEAEPDGKGDPEGNLAASAVSGQAPPAGPEWVSRLAPVEPQALAYDKPLCASLDGFTQSPPQAAAANDEPGRPDLPGGYRPWAELLARTFAVDVLACPTCQRRMKLLALVKGPASIARTLAAAGEATEVPRRSPGRGPPYWKSRVLRRQVLGEEDEGGGRGSGADDVA